MQNNKLNKKQAHNLFLEILLAIPKVRDFSPDEQEYIEVQLYAALTKGIVMALKGKV